MIMMDKILPERKSPRLKEFDYTTPAYYFVTICTKSRRRLFGNISNSKIELNEKGITVRNCLNQLQEHFTNIELDCFAIMPDHFHGIIILNGPVGLSSPKTGIKTNKFSLSQIIAYFKYQSTKGINNISGNSGCKVWQRSFYDRIIRNDRELYNIRRYVELNPLKWEIEKNRPENLEI